MTERRRDPLFDALRRAAASHPPKPLSDQRALELVERALRAASEDPARAPMPLGSPIRPWALGALVAAAALVLVLVRPPPAAAPRVEPAAPLAARAEPTRSVLPTGDRLVASPGAAYAVESAEAQRRVRLMRGTLLCDVAALGPRTGFSLATPDLEIEVLGTVFSVDVDASGTTVWVYEGRVRVREGESVSVLEAGESTRVRVDPLATEARDAAQHRSEERASGAEPARPAVRSRSRAPRAARSAPVSLQAARALLAQRRAGEALEHADARLARGLDADWLVLRAEALRALERHAEAVATLERAASIAPQRRSAIGYRIASTRYRSLRDAEGALDALDAYGVAGPGSPLAERGLALEIDACAHLGRAAQRRDAIERYLARFPDTTRAAGLRAE